MGTGDRGDAPPVQTMIGMGSVGASGKKDEPDPDGSVLGLQLPTAGAGERANDDILGDTPRGAQPDVAEPEVYAPVIPQVPLHRRVIHELDTFFSPPWTKQKKIVVGASVGSLAFLLVCILVARGASSTESGLVASTPGSGAAAPVVAVRKALHITADGPIASVTVGDRLVDVATPKPAIDVDLLEAEQNKPLHLVVTGKDGRIALATAEPSTRGLDVTLTDEPAALELPSPPAPSTTVAHADTAQALPPPAPPPKEKRTWPRRGVKK